MKKRNNTNVEKEEHLKVSGIVKTSLPGTKYIVSLTSLNKEVRCTMSGKLRINKIQIIEGDSVEVELSPYDLNSGIIVWRNK